MDYTIGVDIGGTNIVFGLVDAVGNVCTQVTLPTNAADGTEVVVQRVLDGVRNTLATADVSHSQLLSVGVGVPGFVNPQSGLVVSNVNLGMRDVPLAQWLSDAMHVPVWIDNDVRMYVYGEAVYGEGQGYHHVLGVTVGTGIAAALVVDGAIYYGRNFAAGEIGHVPVEGNSLPCGCGLVGCLETVASARGMARLAVQAIKAGESSILRDWYDEDRLDSITSADLSRAFDAGDALAIHVIEKAGHLIGIGLGHAIAILGPDVLILGGGVLKAGGRLVKPIKESLERWTTPSMLKELPVLPARHMDDAGVLGSAWYARQRLVGK